MAIGIVWTNNGQGFAIDALDPATRAALTTTDHIAWGSSATTPVVADSALIAENPEARTTATISQPASDTIRYVGTIVATGARTVQEVGVFSASAAGVCKIRAVHGSLSLETGDSVQYTINLLVKDLTE